MALVGDYTRLNNQLFAFGQEDVLYQRSTVIKGRGILRAATIDLTTAVAAVSKREDGADVAGIEVYADVVTSSAQIVLPAGCSTLVIFARKAFEGQTTVDIKYSNKVLQVLVYTLTIAESKLSFNLVSQKSQQVDLDFAVDSAGARLIITSSVKQVSLGPSKAHFDSISLTDQILSTAEPDTFEEANE